MREQIQKVLKMLSPDFDWENHWEKDNAEGIEDEFRKCVKVITPEQG
jgi:hypothetical protein